MEERTLSTLLLAVYMRHSHGHSGRSVSRIQTRQQQAERPYALDEDNARASEKQRRDTLPHKAPTRRNPVTVATNVQQAQQRAQDAASCCIGRLVLSPLNGSSGQGMR